jgi:hypothetical protein
MARPYVPLSVDVFGDEKILELTPLARLEYFACLCIAKRIESDGRVTLAQVRREQPDVDDHLGLLGELVKHELLVQEDDRTFAICAWLRWNKSAAELEQLREKKAEAGQRGGQKSGERRAQQAEAQRSTLLHHDEAPGEPKSTTTEVTTTDLNGTEGASAERPPGPGSRAEPHLEKAQELAELAWQQPITPTVSRRQTKNIIRSVLRSGEPVADVDAVVRAGLRVWTVNGFKVELAQRRRDSARASPASSGSAIAGAMAKKGARP